VAGVSSGLRGALLAGLSVLLLMGMGGCGGSAGRVREFATYGAGAGGLREPFGIAVDWRSGDVFVVDTNNWRVDKFTARGRFVMAWGWGVGNGVTRALESCRRRCFAGVQGAGAGEFQFPEGIAVDNDPHSASFGDVYVVDIYNRRVQKFTAAGRFLLMFGGGVNRTARQRRESAGQDVCPVRRGDVCGAGREGGAGGTLELTVEGSFIAVAPEGVVWVGQHNRLKAFSPAGHYLREIQMRPLPTPGDGNEAGGVSGLAVNGTGDFYVIRHGISGVQEYAPSGGLVRTLERGDEPAYDEGPTPTVTQDRKGNVFVDVYAHEVHRIDEFSPDGVKVASFDRGRKAPPQIADREDGLPGMAYDPKTKQLYLVNADINVRPRVARIRALTPPLP
jgi:hypothetical protein